MTSREISVASRSCQAAPLKATPLWKWCAYAFLHVIAVYGSAIVCAPFLGGLFYGRIAPLFTAPVTKSPLQLYFDHALILVLLPAMVAGWINCRFGHRIARWVWIVPTTVIAWKLVSFAPIAGEPHWISALHFYFGSYWEMPQSIMYGQRFDPYALKVFFAREYVSSPFYAGIVYSAAAILWDMVGHRGSQGAH